MEMPMVDPAQAASGRQPSDGSAARPGTTRRLGEAGEIPIVSEAQVRAGIAPSGASNGGRVRRQQPPDAGGASPVASSTAPPARDIGLDPTLEIPAAPSAAPRNGIPPTRENPRLPPTRPGD